MRSIALHIAGLLLIAGLLGQAQSTTADGVDAFVRGDYQQAVEILKPIAEAWPSRDHVAEFFMATLYENGRGVPVDLVRACALYSRASMDHVKPIGQQAAALLGSLQGSLSREEFQRCNRMASAGFDRPFDAVTFTLEPGHWILIDPDAVTITYNGREKRTGLGRGNQGERFLPIEHTELTVGHAPVMRRHFIEFFVWLPGPTNQNIRTWTLTWSVSEVIRNDLVGVASADLTTISAERPPTDSSVDVHSMARLRVNERGNVEWAVLSGTIPHAGVIESEAERQERIEQARARQAADARVDWKRVSDVHRAPALKYIDADGCDHISVYGWSDDRSEAITIRASKDLLGLSTTPRTFEVASQPTNLELMVHVYERPIGSQQFCTDARMPSGPEEIWRAVGGTVTIELSPPGVRAAIPFAYRATIHIVGAEFVSTTGVRARQVQPITLSAVVGFMFG